MLLSATRLLWCVALSAPAIAHADLYARYLPYPPPPEGEVYDNLDVYVSQGKVLMTGRSKSGTVYSVWFDGADGSFRVYDSGSHGYYMFGTESFASVVSQKRSFRAEMETKLNSVPESQREVMRRTLEQVERELLGGTAPEPYEYRKTKVGHSISGIACNETQVLHGQEVVRLLCTAEPRNITDSEDDRRTLIKMQRIAREIAFGTRQGFGLVPRYPLDLEAGFPVRIQYLDEGQELRLAATSSEPVDPVLLQSYRKSRRLPLPGI